jgi:hypothetical protein
MANLNIANDQLLSNFNERITANMRVVASWVDEGTGKRISTNGFTENLGESGALVNLELLPPVGSAVKLRIFDQDKMVIEVPTEVIRVERDPAQPLAALNVVQNMRKWKDVALTAAQAWATRHWQLNYEEEWVN